MTLQLVVRDLNTFYGAIHALQNISLTIAEGEIVALLGRNGMGKSTTMKSIMGITRPRSGSIRFNGNELAGLPPHKIAQAGIGYVPEDRQVFGNLTIEENLAMGQMGLKNKNASGPTWTLDRIYQHFPFMVKKRHLKARFISGGEQQMLSIARALMGNPSLLLIDEPSEGLSPIIVNEVRDILAEINKEGVSVLLVEHNYKVAVYLAKRVYLMGKAHIGYENSVEHLEAHPDIRSQFLEV